MSLTVSGVDERGAAGDDSLVVAVRVLRGLEVGSLDAAGVRAAMRELRPVRGWLDRVDGELRSRARDLNEAAEAAERERRREQVGADADAGADAGAGAGAGGDGGGGGWGGVPADSLDEDSGVGRGEGRRRDARSLLLDRFAGLCEPLAAGVVTVDHLDVIVGVINTATDEVADALDRYQHRIVELACSCAPGVLRRRLHQLLRRVASELGVELRRQQREATSLRHWVDRITGLGRLSGTFDPESFKVLVTLLDRATAHVAGDLRDVDVDRVRADVLIDMLKAAVAKQGRSSSTPGAGSAGSAGGGGGDVPAGEPPVDFSRVRGTDVMISVVTDLETFMRGQHPDTVCEHADGTPLKVSLMRRWACEAGIVPVVLDGDGVPLDVGRASRYATPDQRRALQAIYATCGVSGCEAAVTRCEVHHIDYWEDGNDSDLDNLIPVCPYHHHRIHDENWRLHLDATRQLTVIKPDGSISSARPDRLPPRRSGGRGTRTGTDDDPTNPTP